MKIALVTHNVIRNDGQGRVNLELARYLAQQGHEVHLYAHRIDPDLAALSGVVPHFIPLRVERPVLFKCLEFWVKATRLLERAQVDLVHLNGAVAGVPHQVNTCHFCHAAWAKVAGEIGGQVSLYHRLFTRLNARWERKVYRQHAQCVVGVSKKVQRELTEEVGVPLGKTKVIHNGIDPEEFSPASGSREREEGRRSLRLSPSAFLFFFAGDLRRNIKGLGFLLQAFAGFKEPEAHLLVAGRWEGSPFPALAERLGLAPQVHFLGFRRDMPRWMRTVEAFVYPTQYEPFSIVTLEALASGLAVAVSAPQYCGVAELIQPGSSGLWLENPRSPEEIREAMTCLMRDDGLRKRLGEGGRRVAEGRSWRKMATEYESLYEVILSHGA